jgi:transposase
MNEKRQEKRVIGLDVHPYLFTAAALAGADALQAKMEWCVDRVDLRRLESILKKRTQPGDVVVLEASGNSFAVAQRLTKIGLRPVVLESQAVGKVGKAYCATDKIDAIKIARVYLSGLAHAVWQPDAQSAERREVFFGHRNAVRDSTRGRNQIWAFLNQQCVKRPKGLRLTDPKALDKLLALHKWTDTQRWLLAELVDVFQKADERRKRFRARIAEEVAGDPNVLRMVRLMGIREQIAFALAAFIGDVGRFATPKKLVAFFGLNPRVSFSGIGGSTGSLTGLGRGDVRALLIQGAQSVLRYGQGSTHKWAVALKMRRGTNVAVAALARKMVVSIWYLLKGLMVPMKEATPQIAVKMNKIAAVIGRNRLREMGYETASLFVQEKIGIVTGVA